MAYGTIIEIQYKDIANIDTIIRVKQKDYTGAVNYRDANAGIRIDCGDSSNNLPIIYGSQCTVYIDAEADYEFLYLFSEDAREHLVEVTKAGSLFWTGFVEPGSWSEPLIATPYPVEFTAYDMLGFLKDVDFVDASGNAYTGVKTMIEIIQIILAKTGLNLTLNTAVEFTETSQSSGTDYFTHKKNCEVFEAMSCYDVLTQLLQGCRIQQRNAQWWIISNSNATSGSSFGYFIYENGSAVSSGTDSLSIEDGSDWWFEGEALMEMLPALKKLNLSQDYGYKSNLFKNGSFTDFDVDGFPLYWNKMVGDETVSQKSLNDEGDKYSFIEGRSKPSEPYDLATGIYHDPVYFQADENLIIKLNLKYALMGNNGESCHMYISVRLDGEDGITYHLRQYGDTDTKKITYAWVNDYRCAVTMNYHYSPNYATHINPDKVEAHPFEEIQDNFSSFEASIPAPPVSGDVYLYLYKAYSSRTGVQGVCYTAVSLEALQENEEEFATSQTLSVINNSNNNYVPDDLELIIGDVPDMANNKIVYLGGILRTDGSLTTGWTIGASASFGWAELIGRLYASSQRVPRRNYKCTIADIVPQLNLVISDPNNSNIRLIETSISYDDQMLTMDAQYTEVLSLSLMNGQVGKFEVITNASTTSSSETSSDKKATVSTSDTKVEVVGADGEKLSPAGKMDGVYFDGITSEEDNSDGITRIRNRKETVDPFMLAFDSGTPQFSLKSATIQSNYDGNKNKLLIKSGTLINHQFNALARDEIQKLKDAAEEYDPTRSWTIDQEEITLGTDNAYFVYVKVPLATGVSTTEIITSEDHIEVKDTDDYLHYKVAHIPAVEDGKRKVNTLWGNDNNLPKLWAERVMSDATLPTSTGNNAIAFGEGNIATSFRETVFGSYAIPSAGSSNSWIATDELFTIGNGSGVGFESNALEIYKSGFAVFDNAIKLGTFSHGANDPTAGVIHYDLVDGFQAYSGSDWNRFAFIDTGVQDNDMVYYESLTQRLKRTGFSYTEVVLNSDIANMVTAASTLTTNYLIKGQDGTRGVQTTGVIVDASNNMATTGWLMGSTAKLTNLTPQYVPYVNSGGDMANSPFQTNGTDVSIGIAPNSNFRTYIYDNSSDANAWALNVFQDGALGNGVRFDVEGNSSNQIAILVRGNSGANDLFKILANGPATFSSSVQATNIKLTNGSSGLDINPGFSGNATISLTTNGSSYAKLQTSAYGIGYSMPFIINPSGGNVYIGPTTNPAYATPFFVKGTSSFANGTPGGSEVVYFSSTKDGASTDAWERNGALRARYQNTAWNSATFDILGPDASGYGVPTPYISLYQQKVGFGTSKPAYEIDNIGDINTTETYRISGTSIFDRQNTWTAINTFQNSDGFIRLYNNLSTVRSSGIEVNSSGDVYFGTATTAGTIYLETGHSTAGLPSTGTKRAAFSALGLNLLTGTYLLNGVDINMGGLSNVAYLNQANVFTVKNTFNGGLTIGGDGGSGIGAIRKAGANLIIQSNTNSFYIANSDNSLINFQTLDATGNGIFRGSVQATQGKFTTGASLGYFGLSSADGTLTWTNPSSINLSGFNNDANYLTSITKSMVESVLTGTITSHTHNYDNYNHWVLGIGASSYNITSGMTTAFAGSGGISVSYNANTVTIDGSGVGSVDYVSGGSFNPSTGDITLSGVGSAGAVFNMDGRYATESWVTSNFDKYTQWKLYTEDVFRANVGSNTALGFNGTGGISVSYNANVVTIDGSGVGGSMVYPAAGIAVSTGSAWGTSITDNSANWNSAYTHSQLTSGNPHNIAKSDIGLGNVENTALSTWTGSGGSLNNIYITNGAGYITSSALSGYATQSWVTSQNYLTANQNITLSGVVTGSGTTSITTYLSNNVIAESHLYCSNAPTNGYVLSYNSGTSGFTWVENTGSGMTNPMTSLGDLIYGSVTGQPTRLALGANGKILTAHLGSVSWQDPVHKVAIGTGTTGYNLSSGFFQQSGGYILPITGSIASGSSALVSSGSIFTALGTKANLAGTYNQPFSASEFRINASDDSGWAVTSSGSTWQAQYNSATKMSLDSTGLLDATKIRINSAITLEIDASYFYIKDGTTILMKISRGSYPHQMDVEDLKRNTSLNP